MRKSSTKTTKKTTRKPTSRKVSKTSRTTGSTKKVVSRKSTRTSRLTNSTISFTFKDSSFVTGFRWVSNPTDMTTGNLTVSMKDGSRYLYRNVSKQIVQNWRRRQSAGSFFVKYIKEMKSERV